MSCRSESTVLFWRDSKMICPDISFRHFLSDIKYTIKYYNIWNIDLLLIKFKMVGDQ